MKKEITWEYDSAHGPVLDEVAQEPALNNLAKLAVEQLRTIREAGHEEHIELTISNVKLSKDYSEMCEDLMKTFRKQETSTDNPRYWVKDLERGNPKNDYERGVKEIYFKDSLSLGAEFSPSGWRHPDKKPRIELEIGNIIYVCAGAHVSVHLRASVNLSQGD